MAEPAADRFADDTHVSAPRRLTVEEIVARHQAAAARQAAAVRTLTSSGTLTVTFEAPDSPRRSPSPARRPSSRRADATDLEQRDIRINGVALRQKGTPKLPIIEPERVAAPPLAITLGDRYRYRLAGEDTVAGVGVYVVAFEPVDARITAFRGRAWIARDDFGSSESRRRRPRFGGR